MTRAELARRARSVADGMRIARAVDHEAGELAKTAAAWESFSVALAVEALRYLQHVEMTPAEIREYWERNAPQANCMRVVAVDRKRGIVTMEMVVRGKPDKRPRKARR